MFLFHVLVTLLCVNDFRYSNDATQGIKDGSSASLEKAHLECFTEVMFTSTKTQYPL